MAMTLNKVLVAGAGGYLGIPICLALLSRGYEVVALDCYFFGVNKIMAGADVHGLRIVKGDTRYIDRSYLDDVCAVIDLAGLSNDASAEIDPYVTEAINCVGGKRLAQLAKEAGVRRYIYASSASVYGANAGQTLTEEADCKPATIYSRSKLDIESHLLKTATQNFQPVIFRISTVFGVAPRMRFDLVVNLMSLFAWTGQVIRINGHGDQWRPFVHVDDVVQAFVIGLESTHLTVSGQIFNLGSTAMNFQINDIAATISAYLPKVDIKYLPDDVDRISYQVSFAKIENKLGFRTRFSLNNGIEEIFDALNAGDISGDDQRGYTAQWYRSIFGGSNALP